VIKPGVRIASGCSIGPFARLRPGTILSRGVEIGNFVELCRTEIGENTKVKHHTYLGDTVVGSNVNIGAGTITANYDGEKKNRTAFFLNEDNTAPKWVLTVRSPGFLTASAKDIGTRGKPRRAITRTDHIHES